MNVGTALKQESHKFRTVVERSRMQRSLTASILCINIGAALKQESSIIDKVLVDSLIQPRLSSIVLGVDVGLNVLCVDVWGGLGCV
jgi:hypothetical protein